MTDKRSPHPKPASGAHRLASRKDSVQQPAKSRESNAPPSNKTSVDPKAAKLKREGEWIKPPLAPDAAFAAGNDNTDENPEGEPNEPGDSGIDPFTNDDALIESFGNDIEGLVDVDDADNAFLAESSETGDVDTSKRRRYHHESEIFGATDLPTGRAKLELLEEERRLKELLGDSF